MKTSGDPSDSAPAAQGLKRDRPESELDRSLLSLGEKSLAEGRPKEAAARFQRVLKRSPDSASARRGLARAELAQGNLDAAREWLGPEPLRRLGNLGAAGGHGPTSTEERSGAPESERRALAENRGRRSDAVPGSSTARRPGGAGSAVGFGSRRLTTLSACKGRSSIPTTPKALLDGARVALCARAMQKKAGRWLTRACLVGGRRPGERAAAAIEVLSGIDPAWNDRIVVPVHVYADQSVRA